MRRWYTKLLPIDVPSADSVRRRQDASFSGKAFSVTRGRGRFKSPRGQRAIAAETTQVADDVVDFLGGERVLERRHPAIERANGPAIFDDGVPVGARFGGGNLQSVKSGTRRRTRR